MLDPYPFDTAGLTLEFNGRCIAPSDDDEALRSPFAPTAPTAQPLGFTAAG